MQRNALLSVIRRAGVNDAWWRNQMETFSALLVLCEGNPPVTSGFPSQRPVMWSFDVFFILHLNKRLSKQSRRRWFKTPLHRLWSHSNGILKLGSCPDASSHYKVGIWRLLVFSEIPGIKSAQCIIPPTYLQYIPRNMHRIYSCFVVFCWAQVPVDFLSYKSHVTIRQLS